MLADVLAAARPLGEVLVVAAEAPSLPVGAAPCRPTRAAARARPCDARWTRPSRRAAGAVRRRERRRAVRDRPRPARARRRRARHGLALVAAADGTTNALALADDVLFEPLYGPGSAERFAALAPSTRLDAPNLIDDVDTPTISRGSRPRVGAHTRRVLAALRPRVGRVNVAVLSGGVGGARFLRGARRCRRPRQRFHRRQRRRTTSRCSAFTSRPISTASSTRSPASPTRSAAGAAPARRWQALDTVARARRRGVVPARRPRHRPAPRAHASCCAAARRCREATERIAHARRPRRAAPARDRRPAAHVRRDAGRHVPVPDVVRRARPSRRGRRRPLRRRARRAARARRARRARAAPT